MHGFPSNRYDVLLAVWLITAPSLGCPDDPGGTGSSESDGTSAADDTSTDAGTSAGSNEETSTGESASAGSSSGSGDTSSTGSGTSAGSTSTGADDGETTSDAGDTGDGVFACGDALLCDLDAEYCREQLSDFGGEHVYACAPLPLGCDGGGSCECLASEPCAEFDLCETTPEGGIVLSCPGG